MAVALAVVLSARSSLADHYVVPTGSMLPTVQIDDHVVVDKLAYGLRLPLAQEYALRLADPSAGDVIVLRSPVDDKILLKRVVAVPGDVVTVSDGALTINGAEAPIVFGGDKAIETLGSVRHSVSLDFGGGPDYGPAHLPKDRFLVMGDNRGNSLDGRSFGLVSRDAIVGRVEGVVVRHGSPTWVGLKGDAR